MRGVDVSGYVGLFGEPGLALSEAQWVEHANQHLTPNLSALNTRYLDGSREERWLRMSYEPGPGAFNFAQLSGGSIAEMLDQAATHCGSLVTGCPCPTLSMTVTILRGGTAKSYVATGRMLKLTRVTAVLGADLDDDAGRRIATVTVVSQLITDLSRLT
jgi:acyl-coenzyme A thioesterase PaaI-like protein